MRCIIIDTLKYFDHAATTPMREEVWDLLHQFSRDVFGNPNSLHQFGHLAKYALEEARASVARSIGANETEIVFTGSGTEANNMAVIGAARRMRRLGKGNHIITSGIEHPSVLHTCRALEQEGFEVTYAPVDEAGLVAPAFIQAAIKGSTVLVSVMHANNVVGTIQPIEAIGAITRAKGVLLHTDAVQTYGKIPLDVAQLQVDLLTLNAHKIGGPKGIAALYVRTGTRLDPILHGGGQERAIRSGTQNVPGIVAFAKAATLASEEQPAFAERLHPLRERLLSQLQNSIPGCKLNGHATKTLPTCLNISIDQIEGQALMLELDRLGFATSSGSACSSTENEPSYVLLAMGKSREVAVESLRISLGRTTTKEAVDTFAVALTE
ncbi:cysteine desulfurase family protein, partial [Alicyclobacillus fodiniaquatilis]